MEQLDLIWKKLEEANFKISTDTRKDVSGTVFFGIKGKNFDGTLFAHEALTKGAVEVVTENSLEILQKLARKYRDTFNIPILAIGGSNGKTTTKELLRNILEIKFRTYATEENFNNHLGVPLSIFKMPKDTEIAVFEIGANHLGEHTTLLKILNPTHVLVTNNGLDHLEGFGSKEGVIKANREILDWAEKNNARVITSNDYNLGIASSLPLSINFKNQKYQTKLAGDYNIENIRLALSAGEVFRVPLEDALKAVANYSPTLSRSQLLKKDGNIFILDCYNANPTSMTLALESFFKSAESPRGVILGDMLELGRYSMSEHEKIVEFLSKQPLDITVLIGQHFRKALEMHPTESVHCFENSLQAADWFKTRKFNNYTFLLKGSRGMRVEDVINQASYSTT